MFKMVENLYNIKVARVFKEVKDAAKAVGTDVTTLVQTAVMRELDAMIRTCLPDPGFVQFCTKDG